MNLFSEQLRFWRKAKGFSQLDLSLEANVSCKHISFLETGRSRPSKEMVLLLSSTLDLPLKNRNDLLLASGFSAGYSQMSIHQKEMAGVRTALDLMLEKQEPYPAVVLDWGWNILSANRGFQKLTDWIRSLCSEFSSSKNLVELIFDPKGLKPFISNWQAVASVTIQRLHREKLEHKNRHEALLARLFSYSDTPPQWQSLNFTQHPDPMIYIEFEIESRHLKLFTTLSSFGTPIDITVEEIMIEQYFPANEEAKTFFEEE